VEEAQALREARGTVHVVDDDTAFTTAICRLLKTHGFAAHGYNSSGDFLLAPIKDGPGCILMDLYLPGPSGLELQAALAARQISLPIIFISGRADVPASVRAMKAGAMDFLEKPIDRQTLVEAVGRAIVRSVERRGIQKQWEAQRACYGKLTRREVEVFERVVAGKLNKQIASELGMAERTVKAHRAQVMQKMRVSSVAELVRIADGLARNQSATDKSIDVGYPKNCGASDLRKCTEA
jgi:FixJ family two-component response regulator